MKMKWDVAASLFEPLVEAANFQVRALCALQLASCYFLMGDRAKAQAMFQKVPQYTKKNSSVDPIVVQQAARFQASGGHFAAFELLYIRRDLAKMEKEIPDLMELLEKLAHEIGADHPLAVEAKKEGFGNRLRSLSIGSKPKAETVDYSADNRACYLMLKGSMLKALNKDDEAIACFREVMQLDHSIKEKYYVPYSLYELAECLYHKNNIKEAQEAIKKCNHASGYSWEDPLKVRLRVTMDQLKRGGVLEEEEADIPVPCPVILPSTLGAPATVVANSGEAPVPTPGAPVVASNGAEPPSPTLTDKAPAPAVLPEPVQASS